MTNGTRIPYPHSPRAPGRPDWLERIDIESRIRRAIEQTLSDVDAGIYAGVSWRTVFRYRHKHNIPPNGRRGVRTDPNERPTR